MSRRSQKLLNIGIVGNCEVGKTEVRLRGAGLNPPEVYEHTVIYQCSTDKTDKGESVRFIEVAAGALYNMGLKFNWFKESDICLLLFDLSKPDLSRQATGHLANIREHAPNADIFLIGTHSDCTRMIQQGEIEQFCVDNNIDYDTRYIALNAKKPAEVTQLCQTVRSVVDKRTQELQKRTQDLQHALEDYAKPINSICSFIAFFRHPNRHWRAEVLAVLNENNSHNKDAQALFESLCHKVQEAVSQNGNALNPKGDLARLLAKFSSAPYYLRYPDGFSIDGLTNSQSGAQPK